MLYTDLLPQSVLQRLSKFLCCLLASLLMSAVLFVFMHNLINQPTPELPGVAFSGFVELFSPLPESEIDEISPEPKQSVREPPPQQQSLSMVEAASSQFDIPGTFDFSSEGLFPALSIGNSDNNVQIAQELLGDFGENTQQGFVEITPFTSRRPNIPDIAYENQLNGWVLVIYNVTSRGRTRNIKILDASPKGIFEAEVIRALKRWRYNVSGIISDGQDVVMTQKINLNWKNYKQNLPYAD